MLRHAAAAAALFTRAAAMRLLLARHDAPARCFTRLCAMRAVYDIIIRYIITMRQVWRCCCRVTFMRYVYSCFYATLRYYRLLGFII